MTKSHENWGCAIFLWAHIFSAYNSFNVEKKIFPKTFIHLKSEDNHIILATQSLYGMIGMRGNSLTLWLVQECTNAAIYLVRETYSKAAIWLVQEYTDAAIWLVHEYTNAAIWFMQET